MSQELKRGGLAFASHFQSFTGVGCFVVDIEAGEVITCGGHFCERCAYERCKHVTTHRYGGTESYRWDGIYIYYCPLGLVFAASPLKSEKIKPTLALVAGPVVMGDPGDTPLPIRSAPPEEGVHTLPSFEAPRVNGLANVLSASAAGLSGIPHTPSEAQNPPGSVNILRERLGQSRVYDDLIRFENKLRVLVRAQKKEESQALLNELLGRIYFYSDFKLDLIKARALELVVILSRAVIEAGANIEDILSFNTHSLRDVEASESIDELGAFLTELLHRFVSYSFDFAHAKHWDVVYKAKGYVKANYMNKLTLDDVARHVFLSRAYLSSVFKAETGMTLTSYINKTRIEKSKSLLCETPMGLLDIAFKCGFENQSYFTKVFKDSVGMTPKQYRSRTVRAV